MPIRIKREIFSTSELEESYLLSYITDTGMKYDGSMIQQTQSKVHANQYKNIIALGNGSSYVYPHAMFLGNKQIYPTIAFCYLSLIVPQMSNYNGSNAPQSNAFILSNIGVVAGVSEKTYVFPYTFKVTYSSSPMSNSYVTKFIPSFDTFSQTNNSQWAYFQYGNLYIKDPLLTKRIPSEYYETTTNPASLPSTSQYYTYFKIEVNANVSGSATNANTAEQNKTLYDTTYWPMSYTKTGTSGSPIILRRECDVSSENTTFTTDVQNGTSSGSYYILRLYYKGQPITNLTEQLAYIMPKYGQGGLNYTNTGGGQYTGGVDPTYYGQDKPSRPTGAFLFTQVSDSMPDECVTVFWPNNTNNNPLRPEYHESLFNFHLLKVTGNEDMNRYGQYMRYYNHELSRVPQYYLSDHNGSLIINSNLHINNPFGSQGLITKNLSDTPQFVTNTNNPITNTKLCSIYNGYTGIVGNIHRAAASVSFRYNNYLQSGVVSSITYLSYSITDQFKDVNDITYSYTYVPAHSINVNGFINTIPDTYNYDITITMNNPQLGTITASNAPSYTYCYLAADIINLGFSTIVSTKVLSDSYLCIHKELRTSSTTTTRWITHRV